MGDLLECLGGLFIILVVMVLLIAAAVEVQGVGDKEAYDKGYTTGRCENVNAFILEDTPDRTVIQKCADIRVEVEQGKQSKEKRF